MSARDQCGDPQPPAAVEQQQQEAAASSLSSASLDTEQSELEEEDEEEGGFRLLPAGTAGTADGTVRPGIVHRLDKGTTGLLVVAKTDAAHLSLAQQVCAVAGAREGQLTPAAPCCCLSRGLLRTHQQTGAGVRARLECVQACLLFAARTSALP